MTAGPMAPGGQGARRITKSRDGDTKPGIPPAEEIATASLDAYNSRLDALTRLFAHSIAVHDLRTGDIVMRGLDEVRRAYDSQPRYAVVRRGPARRERRLTGLIGECGGRSPTSGLARPSTVILPFYRWGEGQHPVLLAAGVA